MNKPEHLKIWVTRNSEYHLVGRRCVAVWSRDKRRWDPGHPAVGAKLVGGLARRGYWPVHRTPHAGDRLFFSSDVLTSPVVSSADSEPTRITPQRD